MIKIILVLITIIFFIHMIKIYKNEQKKQPIKNTILPKDNEYHGETSLFECYKNSDCSTIPKSKCYEKFCTDDYYTNI